MLEGPRPNPKPNQQQALYVGKHGKDTNDGETLDKAFLTFGAAITAAGTPASEATAVTLVCLDDGQYDEHDTTMVSYVNIHAPAATIRGRIYFADSTSIRARRLTEVPGADYGVVAGLLVKGSGTGVVHIECDSLEIQTNIAAIYNIQGTVIARVNRLTSVGSSGAVLNRSVGEITRLFLDVADFQVGTGTGVYTQGQSGAYEYSVLRIGLIEGAAGSVGFDIGDYANDDLIVGTINCVSAYDVEAGCLAFRVFVGEIIGTEVVADGANVRVTKARRDNYVATAAPGVGDDEDDGYTVGSDWIDVTADDAYKCVDASSGAAVWKQTTP